MSETKTSFPVKVINFLQSVIKELQKVRWPNRQQVFTLTGVVIAFVLVVGAFLGVFDYIFSSFINWFIQN